MKFLCAPDKFKGSLTAAQAAEAMKRGVRRAVPDAQVELCPVADGGEGTVAAFLECFGAQAARKTKVTGPRGAEVEADWVLFADRQGRRTAVVEAAGACGLELLPIDQRDTMRTSTFGVGQIIAAALTEGAKTIIVGIGGSATTDGGCGCGQALGVEFFDGRERRIDERLTGGVLGSIGQVSIKNRLVIAAGAQILVACDVTNPLTGPCGAAYVYAPQKGASPQQVIELDSNLRHLADLWRRQLGRDVEQMPGAGAAGGLGGGLVVYLNAALRPGAEMILETVGFAQRVAGAALCLTGEGKLDGQTASGKTVMGVAQAAKAQGVATVALVGAVGEGAERTRGQGLAGWELIGPGLSVEESKRRAAELVEQAAARVVQRWVHGG
jgi:glycerate kinase